MLINTFTSPTGSDYELKAELFCEEGDYFANYYINNKLINSTPDMDGDEMSCKYFVSMRREGLANFIVHKSEKRMPTVEELMSGWQNIVNNILNRK